MVQICSPFGNFNDDNKELQIKDFISLSIDKDLQYIGSEVSRAYLSVCVKLVLGRNTILFLGLSVMHVSRNEMQETLF